MSLGSVARRSWRRPSSTSRCLACRLWPVPLPARWSSCGRLRSRLVPTRPSRRRRLRSPRASLLAPGCRWPTSSAVPWRARWGSLRRASWSWVRRRRSARRRSTSSGSAATRRPVWPTCWRRARTSPRPMSPSLATRSARAAWWPLRPVCPWRRRPASCRCSPTTPYSARMRARRSRRSCSGSYRSRMRRPRRWSRWGCSSSTRRARSWASRRWRASCRARSAGCPTSSATLRCRRCLVRTRCGRLRS